MADESNPLRGGDEVQAAEAHDPKAEVQPQAIEEEIENREPKRASLLDQLRARFSSSSQSRELKSSERTRGLVILAGASLACLFLFFGLFTTDADSTKKAKGTTPNLGRPATTPTTAETSTRSAVPQLTVSQQPNEEPNELTEQDLLGTMRNRRASPPSVDSLPANGAKPQTPPAGDLGSVNFADPALTEAYRRQNLAPPPRPTTATNWEEAIAEYQSRQQKTAIPPSQPATPASLADQLRKSSLVYVRSQTALPAGAQVQPAIQRVQRSRLPQGTALIARLQHGVSSAAKAPVIAVVEYNYEDDGQIVVPAGTKAFGELTGATPQGWVTLKFHSLEFPNGETEEIDGSALGMQASGTPRRRVGPEPRQAVPDARVDRCGHYRGFRGRWSRPNRRDRQLDPPPRAYCVQCRVGRRAGDGAPGVPAEHRSCGPSEHSVLPCAAPVGRRPILAVTGCSTAYGSAQSRADEHPDRKSHGGVRS